MHFCGLQRKLYRILRLPERLLLASGHPNKISGKTDRTLKNKHPASLDGIVAVTKSSKQKHMDEFIDVLSKLERRATDCAKANPNYFIIEIEKIGHKTDQNGTRPLQDMQLAIKEQKKQENEKELKKFFGMIQYLAKYIENPSAQTDTSRKLLNLEI